MRFSPTRPLGRSLSEEHVQALLVAPMAAALTIVGLIAAGTTAKGHPVTEADLLLPFCSASPHQATQAPGGRPPAADQLAYRASTADDWVPGGGATPYPAGC